ncbi:hypothetical protein B4U80_09599, partial [Leptotrombidium deliense]
IGSQQCSEDGYFRLDSSIYPTHYTLTIRQDLERLIFEGEVVIHVVSKSRTRFIKLHAKNLTVISAKLVNSNNEIEDIMYCKTEETVAFKFEKDIIGRVKLKILYDGFISDHHLNGLYAFKSNANDVTRYSTATQFEAFSARKAFPCFDEPGFKATFKITIIAPKDRTVLS